MNKNLRKIAVFVVTLVLSLCLLACSGGEASVKMAYLDYGTGIDSLYRYDTDKYFYNDARVQTADPHVIWVPEERDPVYGGYYYMYGTSNVIDKSTVPSHGHDGVHLTAMICHRSTNLSDWETAGAFRGDSLVIYEDEWVYSNVMAPEVLYNEEDQLYYMYFAAASKIDVDGTKEYSGEELWLGRVYQGIATSTTPVGPFRVLHNVVNADGKLITKETPPFNFQLAFKDKYDMTYNWGAIDASPFIDDDGTLYMYINCHPDSNPYSVGAARGIWGMRMKDYITPDYETLSIITAPDYVSVTGTPGDIRPSSLNPQGDYWFRESNNNEAPYMIKHNGKYYMTYSPTGYSDKNYSIHMAVSDNPLSGFVKLSAEEGNPVLYGRSLAYASGVGHHCFLQVGDELFMIYAKWANDAVFGNGWARLAGVERVLWVKNKDGLDVMTANGPSQNLQWVPEKHGLKNLADDATFSVVGGEGAQYLNDGLIPSQEPVQDRIFTTDENVNIKIFLDQPRNVSAIMIYNAYTSETAFSKIKRIKFKLAEQPTWLTGGYDYLVIDDLLFPDVYDYMDQEVPYIVANAPAVAQFDPIKVTSIEIEYDIADRFTLEDRYGDPTTTVEMAEIVVLGE